MSYARTSSCCAIGPSLGENCYLTTRLLLGAFTGSAGMQTCPQDPRLFHPITSQPALLDEEPFLNMLYFLMLSKDLPSLALAQCLALLAPTSGPTIAGYYFPADVSTAKAS